MAEIMWLVRAGEGSYLIDEFARGFIAIGWYELGDLSMVTPQDEIRERCDRAYPDDSPGRVRNAVAMIYRLA